MNRQCEILVKSANETVAVCIDKQNRDEIISYVSQSENHLKNFKLIIQLILEGGCNSDWYYKASENGKFPDVMTMNIMLGRSSGKIYCKEQTINGQNVVVLTEIHEKSKNRTKQTNSTIEKITSYEYEIG